MNSGFELDVVGIGALNLDYTASALKMSSVVGGPSRLERIAEIVRRSTLQFEWGAETVVDEKTIYASLEELGTPSLDATLGGSAFNAIYALAQLGLDIRLGYVGISGRVPIPGLSFVQQMDLHGINRRFVQQDESRSCGICFSYIEDGERTLLTHPGANAELGTFIDENFDSLVEYLASARIIHVTSFLDHNTPGHLLELLRKVKQTNPLTLINFDPGHAWSVTPISDIRGILEMSDYLLVNEREFKALGSHRPDEADERVAERLLNALCTDSAVVVLKRYDGVSAFKLEDGGVVNQHFPQTPLAKEEIHDATGAGDVFAAGLLAVMATDHLRLELGALLGMGLARHKLQYIGSRGNEEFAEIARTLISAREMEKHQATLPRGVFIAHGRDPQWHVVKEFVEQELKWAVFAFESDSWGSKEVTAALSRYLELCSFAICVLTAEDITTSGAGRARQNVIHEAGLFQGRYGFERVLLMIEDGCDVFPGTSGLPTLSFEHNGIDTTFWRLQKMIDAGAPVPHLA